MIHEHREVFAGFEGEILIQIFRQGMISMQLFQMIVQGNGDVRGN